MVLFLFCEYFLEVVHSQIHAQITGKVKSAEKNSDSAKETASKTFISVEKDFFTPKKLKVQSVLLQAIRTPQV